MDTPLISVIIPVHNDIRVARALGSILAQDYVNLEIVVVDDSSDQPELLAYLAQVDCLARVHVVPETCGNPAEAMNVGFRLAHGKYVARQDADDVSHYSRLRKQLAHIQERGLQGTSCQFAYLPGPHPPAWRLPTDPDVIHEGLLRGNCLGGGYLMWERQALLEIGFQKWDYPGCADWHYNILFTRKFRMGVVDEVLYHIEWRAKSPSEQVQIKESDRRLQEDYGNR